MKNKLFGYISFLAIVLVVMASCETDIQKANNEYNFDKVIPVMLGIKGPTNATQTFSEMYSPNYFRGGSTWTWTAVGATIVTTSADTREVEVLFENMGDAMLIATETTMGGITSDPDTLNISVAEFCPMTRDEFLGTWDFEDSGSNVGSGTVTFVAGAAANEIVAEATAGIPAFMAGVFTGWGESFQATFGPEGDISIFINANGSVSIPWTYWGQTLPGPYDYWYWGNGDLTWSGCGAAPTMVFKVNLDYNGNEATPASNRNANLVLTKQ